MNTVALETCPICHRNARVVGEGINNLYSVECLRCERYKITAPAAEDADAMPDDKRWLASAWLVNNPQPLLDDERVDYIVEFAQRPSLSQRAAIALRYLASRFPPGQYFSMAELNQKPEYASFVAHSWSKDARETQFLVSQLLFEELGLSLDRKMAGVT